MPASKCLMSQEMRVQAIGLLSGKLALVLRYRQKPLLTYVLSRALGAAYRGNYQNWPSIGEFDIMENVNGINSVWGTLHCGTNPGGPCDETNGLSASLACPGSPCQGTYHTYSIQHDRSA